MPGLSMRCVPSQPNIMPAPMVYPMPHASSIPPSSMPLYWKWMWSTMMRPGCRATRARAKLCALLPRDLRGAPSVGSVGNHQSSCHGRHGHSGPLPQIPPHLQAHQAAARSATSLTMTLPRWNATVAWLA